MHCDAIRGRRERCDSRAGLTIDCWTVGNSKGQATFDEDEAAVAANLYAVAALSRLTSCV